MREGEREGGGGRVSPCYRELEARAFSASALESKSCSCPSGREMPPR